MNLYKIFDVKSHSKIKDGILKQIENSRGSENWTTPDFKGEYTSFISKTNWDVDLDLIPWIYFLTEEDYFSFEYFLGREYGNRGTEKKICRKWYNQYNPHSGSDHPWHNHAHSNSIACVYYLELSDESLVTILKHPETGEEVIPKVKEGQILTMDANIFHKSPRNFTNTRKTIISFNITFR